MKKILCLILAFSMLLPLFSCKKSEPSYSFINGVSLEEFVIVYSESDHDYSLRAAEYIKNEILARTGLDLPIVPDKEPPYDNEIVVGNTEREISDSLDADTEGLEFAIVAEGGSVALEGDYFIIAAAAYYFIETFVPYDDFHATIPDQAMIREPIVKEANNYIMLIGDGMGVYQTLLYDYLESDADFSDGEDVFYGYMLPSHGFSRTASLSGITDSAAGGTALSSGIKTVNSYVGLDKDGNEVQSLTELCGSMGMATAVMSTEGKTGATPSSFSAHAPDRDDNVEILKSQIALTQEYGTIINCSFDYYTKKYMDRSVESRISETLDELSKDEDGFFMMYEEAHIDKHSHNNDMDKTFLALIRFNQAIGRFMEFAFYNPDTFILITADHETGGLRPSEDGELAYNSDYHTLDNVPIFAYGDGAELFDGKTIENIQIAQTIASFLSVYDFGDQSEFQYLK
ncbi:MAG: alkaline phosphatase [Clostridia bacterium]|nr:alkaline phosphatase [Clostridia bacterium]